MPRRGNKFRNKTLPNTVENRSRSRKEMQEKPTLCEKNNPVDRWLVVFNQFLFSEPGLWLWRWDNIQNEFNGRRSW